MTDKEKLKAAQVRFEERHPGLRKKRASERYMKRRGYAVKEERNIIKEEITDTQNYIKEVWGRETPLRNLNYYEMKKLGDELGMNIFNVKSFQDRYKDNQFKDYTRVCKYCKKDYNLKVKIGIKSKNIGVCYKCKSRNYKKRNKMRRIKNNNKWEELVLDVLREGGNFTNLEIASKFGCSNFPIRHTVKRLVKKRKVILFKVGKTGLVSLK